MSCCRLGRLRAGSLSNASGGKQSCGFNRLGSRICGPIELLKQLGIQNIGSVEAMPWLKKK